MLPLITLLEEAYGDNLRFVYRHFPLMSIHPNALIAAEASEAAAAQGKFWEMHDLLFGRSQEWSALSELDAMATFISYAQELELDASRFGNELQSRTYQDRVMGSYNSAVQLGLGATPTFVVNSRIVPSGTSPQAVIELLLSPPSSYDGPPPQAVDAAKTYAATIRTSKGDIVVELFPDKAPLNVNTFVFLARDGWYDGQQFFYVLPNTVAYSGDPTNMGMTLPFAGFTCQDEISSDVSFNEAGMVALYYTSQPGQNSGLFFITMAPLADANGRFTIIGRVTAGLDILQSLAAVQPGDGSSPDSIETILIEER